MHGKKITYRQEGIKAEVMSFRQRLKVSMVADVRIARGSEFQMTGAAKRKEREPKFVLDGVGTRNCWSEVRRERTD